METSVPDLDATIEETLRYRPTAPIGTRDAVRDTTVLGCPVPKGTTIMWIFTTSSYIRPAVQVEEKRRTQRSQVEKSQGRAIEWDDEDIGFFKPERWLKQDEAGKIAFDGNAGPTTPFGMGPRSCFGRKLAYVQMKIILTMVIWNFELLECPKKLSGHSARLALTYKPHQCFVRLNRFNLESEQDGWI
jgi:cytochrome P450